MEGRLAGATGRCVGRFLLLVFSKRLLQRLHCSLRQRVRWPLRPRGLHSRAKCRRPGLLVPFVAFAFADAFADSTAAIADTPFPDAQRHSGGVPLGQRWLSLDVRG